MHPSVVASYRGGGAGAARLISGNRPSHVALEEAISALYGGTATLFPSGYHANLALFSTLPQRGDSVVSDALNHASIIDGLRLSHADRIVLPHGVTPPSGVRLAVYEGLYSMDGDSPDFSQNPGDTWLAVDEAHAVGAMGPNGRGAAAMQGITPDFLVGTLGKAYGVAGAFVVGPAELRELLLSSGRAFVYTTGMPEPVANAALVAMSLADDERRDRLRSNARRLRSGLSEIGAAVLGVAHIVPVVTGERTMAVAKRLFDGGIFAPGIRYPTVPKGAERVRLTVSAAHTPDQIDRCIDAMGAAIRAG